MERFKLGLVFWVLLLVSVTLPVSAQKQVKKQLYGANLSNGPTGPGGVPLVTGAQFLQALQGGHLMIRLNDGEAGSGVYVRIM